MAIELTRRQQVGRLRRVALRALERYPLDEPRMRFVAHGENTTFRVDAVDRTSGRDSSFLLRVHRPNRHGRDVDSLAAIRSELEWLAAIRAETDLSVPEPVATLDGALVSRSRIEDSDAVGDGGHDGERHGASRCCSLLRWMDGIHHGRSARPVHFYRLGQAMARLHDHADGWAVPDGFTRITWDRETYFGDVMEYGGVPAARVWDLLASPLREKCTEVADRVGALMDGLGTGPDVFGLIHADLHLDNALFAGADVRMIDFDDSGFGFRIYDVAVALWERRHRDDYAVFRDALLDGYTAQRPLPDSQIALVDPFIAAREVAFGLWFAGTAQVNPEFGEKLDDELRFVESSLDRLLPAVRMLPG